MPTAKQAHTLVSHFVKCYEKKYGEKPVINRYSARWGFDAVLMEVSEKETKELIEYYFLTASANNHQLDWFFYNYDKLIIAKRRDDADIEETARIRANTQARVEEWRKKKSGNN